MTVPVVWLSYKSETPARGYWDQAMVEALFSHDLWRPVGAHEFEHLTSLDGLEGASSARRSSRGHASPEIGGWG